MADFILRNLDDSLKDKLRRRAARHRRSMNAELREILKLALSRTQPDSKDELKRLAEDIRSLSEAHRQTPSEQLLREARTDR
jgi:plasmid stability protein